MFAFTFLVATFVTLLLATLWLQEGIWKTFQHRTANAIMVIEDKLNIDDIEQKSKSVKPHLVYKQWQDNRPRSKALVVEYIGNSLKPKVLYP